MLRRHFLRNILAASAASSFLLRAQQAGVNITTLREKFYLIGGGFGNIVVHEESDGLFMIDSGLPDATSGILDKTDKVGNGKVTQLFNTHWHTDHTGSNVILGEKGAKIIAHEAVKTRLAKGQYMTFFKRKVDPMDAAGLPSETFKDKGKIKLTGETVQYEHLPAAHTDGDTVLHFHNANIFHGGDLLFSGMYPFIDYDSAGSLAGMAANAERIHKMVDNNTTVVPGHGPLQKKSDVKDFADMLAASLDVMEKSIKAGKTLEQIQAEKPLATYDAKWGNGMLKPDVWIALNYAGMKKA